MRSVFTDYYCFQKQGKTKHNLFCVASTHSYDSFEIRRCIEPSKETARNDAYNVGDIVWYQDQLWICTKGDASGKNSWAPGVFGWEAYTPTTQKGE